MSSSQAAEDSTAEKADSTVHSTHHGVKKSLQHALSMPLLKFKGRQFLKKPEHRLVAEKDALKWSMMALRLGVLADAVNTTVLQPNFPFLAQPGAHPDSFDSTGPFGFSAATYFLPMTAMLGQTITCAFIGSLSDKIGRRPCMLLCVGVSVIGSIAKFVARESFWGFCAANFCNGLFGATVPVSLAYVSDVHPNRVQKDAEIGQLIGFAMIGMSGGGILAILMEAQGLFAPILVGAALNFCAVILLYIYLIEPNPDFHFDEEADEDEDDAPVTMDKKLTTNVIVGALFDNVGSAGLNMICLSPLAFDIFYANFLAVNEPPVMSDVAFKWITVCVALMIIPGAIMSQPIYGKIGAAGGCVFGNAATAVGIASCLYIAKITPPTKGTLAGFVVALYAIFPFTVISQLSTGPMLDMLAPVNRRGFAQGLNMTVMNFANAVSPFLLGTFADTSGVTACLWTCIGISIFAALVNTPLMFAQKLKRKAPVDYHEAMQYEDGEMVELANKGKWVNPAILYDLNDKRMKNGFPFLIPAVVKYEDDKENMNELKKHIAEDFRFYRDKGYFHLNELADDEEKKKLVVKQLHRSVPSIADQDARAEEMGRWFAEHLKASGYFIDGGIPTLMKQIIMEAFPVIAEGRELTEDNIEKALLRWTAVTNQHLDKTGPTGATRAFRNSIVWA